MTAIFISNICPWLFKMVVAAAIMIGTLIDWCTSFMYTFDTLLNSLSMHPRSSTLCAGVANTFEKSFLIFS